MNFSITIPTRGRPANVKRLVDSILKTASRPNQVEIILRVDDDDETVSKIAVSAKIITGTRLHFLSDLWQDCYEHTTADRIMMCGDDAVFKTAGWDDKIAAKTPHPDKRFYFIWGNDLNQRRGLATFPIMSRKWIEAVGYFVPLGYECDYCDTHLHDIANRLNKMGSDVRFYFDNITFEHMHPSIGKSKWDPTYSHRRSKSSSSSAVYRSRATARQNVAAKIHKMIQNGVPVTKPIGFAHLPKGHNEASSYVKKARG